MNLLDSSRFFFVIFLKIIPNILFVFLIFFLSLIAVRYNTLIFNIFNHGFAASKHQGVGADG